MINAEQTIKVASQILALAALLSLGTLRAFGQGDDASRRRSDQDLEQRVFSLGLLRKGILGKSTANERAAKVSLAQVQDDFNTLQVVNNYLADIVSRGAMLDLPAVAKSVSEIEKRAESLMNNLTQPSRRSSRALARRLRLLTQKQRLTARN